MRNNLSLLPDQGMRVALASFRPWGALRPVRSARDAWRSMSTSQQASTVDCSQVCASPACDRLPVHSRMLLMTIYLGLLSSGTTLFAAYCTCHQGSLLLYKKFSAVCMLPHCWQCCGGIRSSGGFSQHELIVTHKHCSRNSSLGRFKFPALRCLPSHNHRSHW